MKGECKYCYTNGDGWEPDDRKNIIDWKKVKIPMPLILETTDGRSNVAIKKEVEICLGAGCDGEYKFILYSEEEEEIYTKNLGFKYCPMCGRRLNNERK